MGLTQDLVKWATAPDKPELPPWAVINPQEEQRTAIKGNIGALPKLAELAAGVNEITMSEFNKNMERILPGYTKLRDKGTANILDWESGNLSPEIQDLISRKAAEGARTSGTSGSQYANFKEARTLGLTALDLQRQGTSAAQSWISAAASRTPQFDVTSMFINPMQQIQVSTNERNAKWNYDWAKEQWDKTPSPKEQALNQFWSDSAGVVDNIASFYTFGLIPGAEGGGSGSAFSGVFGSLGGGEDAEGKNKGGYTGALKSFWGT